MNNLCRQALLKCNTFPDMLLALRNFYFVNSEVGTLTKSLIIGGINAKMEKKISNEVVEKIKKSNTVGDMIAMLSDHYNDVIIKPEHKLKVIDGLGTIIVMTRLKAK